MPRWKPGAQERLETAALELFAEQGYEGTTVADIAERAGLQKRSFFRYFPDKREVLFAGSCALGDRLRRSVATAADDAPPWATALAALADTGDILTADHALSRIRRTVIAANQELREREVLKAAQLEDLLSALLEDRTGDTSSARLLARLALVVYQQAFDFWLNGDPDQPFADCMSRAVTDVGRALR